MQAKLFPFGKLSKLKSAAHQQIYAPWLGNNTFCVTNTGLVLSPKDIRYVQLAVYLADFFEIIYASQ